MPANDLGPPGLTLNDLLVSANDAAVTARNVTTAMLATAVTLAATILASSDEAILRDQLSAPFGLGVTIRLSTAYALMPPVFLFLHVNGLLQLHVLAERLKLFEHQLHQYVASAKERDKWRRRLHGFAFVQHFSDDESLSEPQDRLLEYVRNLLLMTVNLVTIGIVPLMLLLTAQVSFLRYQSETITLVHRVIVLLDLTFVIWFHISQARLSRRVSERPSILLTVGGIIVAGAWLMGWNTWVSGALILGLLTGWAVEVVGQVTQRTRIVLPLTGLLGFAVWWTISAHEIFLIAWALGLVVSFLFLRIWQRTPLKALSRISSLTLVKTAYWIVRYVPISLIVIWFADSQAVVPSGSEPACQIRWSWYVIDEAVSKSVQQVSPTTADSSYFEFVDWMEDERTYSRARLTAILDYVVAPLFGFGQRDCPSSSSDDETIMQRSTTTERSNLLDRWTCSLWMVGCRYINLPSSILVGSAQNASAIEKLKTIDEEEKQEATLRSLGLPLRDRRLRFANMARTRLYGADLRGADLRGARLNRANLTGALMSDADIESANLSYSILESADLSDAYLLGSKLYAANLSKSRLDEAELSFADLRYADAQNASFWSSSLQFADMTSVDLTGAILDGANLEAADMVSSTLDAASMWSTDLRTAHLALSSMDGAILFDAVLDGADLGSVDLTNAIVVRSSFLGASVPTSCQHLIGIEVQTGEWTIERRQTYFDSFAKWLPDFVSESRIEKFKSKVLKTDAPSSRFACPELLSKTTTLPPDAISNLVQWACTEKQNGASLVRNLDELFTVVLMEEEADRSLMPLLEELMNSSTKALLLELKKDRDLRCEGLQNIPDRDVEMLKGIVE